MKYSTLHDNRSGQLENASGIFDSRNGHDVQPVVIQSTINRRPRPYLLRQPDAEVRQIAAR